MHSTLLKAGDDPRLIDIFVKSLYFKIKSQDKETLVFLQDTGFEIKNAFLGSRASSVEKLMVIVATI